MGRNIVICCDGTGNEFGEANTNVVKAYEALDLTDASRQVAYYDPGVGTGNPRDASSWLGRKWDAAKGLAVGAGLFRNVADACSYLAFEYQPGDHVYVFGFSRGAYTVRALAGFVHMFGLLRRGSENMIPYALELYRKRIPSDAASRGKHFALAAAFKETYSRDCPIHFIGVWDTVKTVGVWDALKLASGLQTALPYTSNLAGVSFGRHAVAIDERRSRFRTNLWEPRSDCSTQQVWFSGVHCDVGGGYATSGLSDFALRWMLSGAQYQGLLLKPHFDARLRPDAAQEPNDSLTWKWRALGWKKRQVRGPGEWDDATRQWRALPPVIHESVRHREQVRADYRPGIPRSAIVVDDAWVSYRES